MCVRLNVDSEPRQEGQQSVWKDPAPVCVEVGSLKWEMNGDYNCRDCLSIESTTKASAHWC